MQQHPRRQRTSTGRCPKSSSFAVSAANRSTGVSSPSGSLTTPGDPGVRLAAGFDAALLRVSVELFTVASWVAV
ncbi:MAG: hypothetical protein ABSD85_14020 [Acidimicrobiales bacterium]